MVLEINPMSQSPAPDFEESVLLEYPARMRFPARIRPGA